MHGPPLATLLVAVTLGFALEGPSAVAADAVAEARRKLDADDGAGAVAVLESALPEAGAEKPALLDLLRRAYDAAAKQAEAAGKPSEAETYRENLKILTRKPRPSPAPASPVVAEAPAEALPPTPVAPAEAPIALTAIDTGTPPALPMEAGPRPPTNPERSVDVPPSELEAADAAFVARDYLAAGRIYAKLASEKRLPAARRDQWLYSRAADVVARINARPKSEAEWTSIRAEVDQIRSLNPNNYLGEYLRDLVAERQAGRKKAKVSRAMVVRGSAPDEPPPVDRPVRPASNLTVPEGPKTPSAPTPAPGTAPAATKVGTTAGRWQVLDSANFRIYHADAGLAARVAQAAEAARRDQVKRWSGTQPRGGWQPTCEIYLYPTARQYASMTGQPEDSPGYSTMGMNAGRITSRRINLRADHPALVPAVLPHEITHVILADHFAEKQIPRWADEGISVLSEPLDEQKRRAADLATPLADNRLFAIDALMNMDYPEERYWGLYYAQSVSLTRFLVEAGTPAQMIRFLQEAQRDGYEPALRRVYNIEGFADLQDRWVAYARSNAQGPAVAAGPAANRPDVKAR